MIGSPIALNGCAPTPLASYLKALGILRLISSPANHVSGEAADPHARGWWQDECFHLRTTLSRDALLHFFLCDYAPSPIIAPWNGRAGFLEGDEGEASNRTGAVLMNAIEKSACLRLGGMRGTVELLRTNSYLERYNRLRVKANALKKGSKRLSGDKKKANNVEKSHVEKEGRAVKSLLLPTLRSETDEYHVRYLDACYVLAAEETTAPLLGSGGNDGSRDFGANFAERLRDLIEFDDGTPTERASAELDSAMFGVGQRNEVRGSMGQFSPGQGGPNATTGYTGDNPLNSWDVVLAMEGTLTFAGVLTRRWGAASGSRSAFPFTFEPVGAGTGILSSEDPNRPRGEVWTPLWPKPAKLAEIAAILAEGRLTVGQRIARTGLDAARSVAQLGASRGIASFERYSFIQPDRKMPFQATPLGRFDTPDRPRGDLIADLESGRWLERTQQSAGSRKTAPARARHALRRLEDALFQMTIADRVPNGARSALTALGSLVGWLATSRNARIHCKPPPILSSGWLLEANDDSPEFRIAVALAGIGLPEPAHLTSTAPELGEYGGNEVTEVANGPSASERLPNPPQVASRLHPPMSAHLAPVDEKSFFYKGRLSGRRAWAGGDAPSTTVWGTGPLVSNMIAVLERRLVEAAIRGLEDKPLASAAVARPSDVAAFLSGDFDDARCAALLAGLVWARPMRLRSTHAHGSPSPLPFAYAALKPLFTPDAVLQSVGALSGTAQLPVPPGLIARLRASGGSRDGRATDPVVRLALARARASGLPSPFDTARSGTREPVGRMGAGVPADRLAASLLIPIGDSALSALVERAYPGALPEDDTVMMEDTKNAD